ncbi:MAG: glucose-6-phosphate isomerase [Chloroflexi bacterium]|nr:glucose-6-phosphate isomerase [Chloroflexota bacterium]
MPHVSLDTEFLQPPLSKDFLSESDPELLSAMEAVRMKNGAGSDFLGWLDLPKKMTPQIPVINRAAMKIREESDIVLVLGIGGSYLGAKAALSALGPRLPELSTESPRVIFAGQNLSTSWLKDILSGIKDSRVSLIVISKSGTTTETSVSFRIFREFLVKKYGREEAASRIYAITDAARGALKTEADREGYTKFVIPDDVGGRFSVLTPVGLLPMAVAGIDISEVLAGADDYAARAFSHDFRENPAACYALARYKLYKEACCIEILSVFDPALSSFAGWWQQLFGESEGKDGKSLFPASATFTTDLHSLGQWIQDGPRNIFETFLTIENEEDEIYLPEEKGDLDGLNYLAGKPVSYINKMAFKGTRKAHRDGNVPCMTLSMDRLNPESLGELFYFMEAAVAFSGYMLEVNPFNQPGVESYKKEMFRLLGKPGY